MNDMNLRKFNLFKEGISLMFSAYNRSLTKLEADRKVDSLMDYLQKLPENKILDFFKAVPKNFQLLPTDAQLMVYLSQFNGGGRQSTASQKYDLRYGYFTPQGCYVPHGTKIDFMRAPESLLSKRQIDFRNMHLQGTLPIEFKPEFTTYYETDFDYPRGIVQKHKSVWGKKDYQASGMDCPDYITF